ncbi:unnamed protein product [Adineta ricciae]|uniref:F-box domain-containing protein n=1 Tax=Adineta ricciae TaxID=249248 RepID=A0A816C1H0_ADIRI|nr:unnamed protein product [Adineta ricciae]
MVINKLHQQNYTLESLPNKLLFEISSYLDSVHLIQAFHGLNYRFNLIIYQSVRHFTISKDTSGNVLDTYDSNIENVIEQIFIDREMCPYTFLSINSCINLRSIVRRCADFAIIDLTVNYCLADDDIHSCLDVLNVCNILPANWFNSNWFCDHKLDKSVCLAMTRLCLERCSEQALHLLCNLIPNVTYLKIKQLSAVDDRSYYCSELPFSHQCVPVLKQLHIATGINRLDDIRSIERLIDTYKSSLEFCSLNISLNEPISGSYLQQNIFEPCQNLNKFTFAFNYWQDDIEEADVLYQFQSDWWLDTQRPPVLIFCGNLREVFIVSMPCHLCDYLWLPTDPRDWLLNKGDFDSPDVCFTKQTHIRLINHHRQPITFELVNIIGRVFQAPKQQLSLVRWNFVSQNSLFEQLITTSSTDPVLPLVYFLDLNSCGVDELDAKTLIIWLMIASNVRMINVCQGTPSGKIRLINQLKMLLDRDKRLKSLTDAIEEIHVFYNFDSLSYATKQHICQMCSEVFQKAVIHC